jgi:DNA-binding protein HU-beta
MSSRKGSSVNKSQLIDALSKHYEGNKKAAQHALESVLDTITREVAKGEKVAITGFGAFEKAIRPARMVRNPRTGERTRAKKTAVPKFRAGADLKAVVSGAKKLPTLAASTLAAASPAKKTATKSTAKKAAKKAPAKKAPAKKAPAKKAAAKKTVAKKTTAKKTVAKKTTAKKTVAKKAPAKKTTAKKAPAKKAPAKKTAAKKAPAKKTAKKS